MLETLINRDTACNSSTLPKDFLIDPIANVEAFYEREKKLTQYSKQPDSDKNFKSLRQNMVR